MVWSGELDTHDVSAAIDVEIARWEAEKQTWPTVTDCDRLDAAFAALNERGVIALQNAGYTQSDGYDDFRGCPGSDEVICSPVVPGKNNEPRLTLLRPSD